jgi:hypothetical protein
MTAVLLGFEYFFHLLDLWWLHLHVLIANSYTDWNIDSFDVV